MCLSTQRARTKTLGWVDVAPVTALVVPIVAILTKSFELGPSCAVLGGPLDVRLVNYLLEWGHLQLRGAVPDGSLWSPPFFYPVPNTLAYSENFLSGSILYAPLRWLGLGPSAAVFFFDLTHRALTPVVAYFCLRAMRLGRWPSFLGAMVFSWGWIRFFHYGHIQFSAGYPIPLHFTALYFAVHRRRPWAVALTAWTFLFTWYFSLYTAIFLFIGTLALAAVWLVLPGSLRHLLGTLRFYRRFATGRPLQASVICLLCVLAVALILPSAHVYANVQKEFGNISQGEMRTYWGDVFSWVRPPARHPWMGSLHSLFPKVEGAVWEKLVFIGWLGLLGLLLPGVGFLLRRRRIYPLWPRSLIAVSGAGVGLMLLFSSYGGRPLEALFLFLHRHLPGLASIRVPTRIAFVIGWFVVLCLAVHLQRLSRSRSRLRRGAAWGLGLVLLAENVAPLPRVVDRCADEVVWNETAEHLCPQVPRDEVGTLLFLPTEITSIQRVTQQTLAMRLSQRCDLNVVNGYSGRQPTLIAPLLLPRPEALSCETVQGVADQVHQASGKALLIHLDHGAPLGPAGYSAEEVRDCLQSCLAPQPGWYEPQPGRPATVWVTDVRGGCAHGGLPLRQTPE